MQLAIVCQTRQSCPLLIPKPGWAHQTGSAISDEKGPPGLTDNCQLHVAAASRHRLHQYPHPLQLAVGIVVSVNARLQVVH